MGPGLERVCVIGGGSIGSLLAGHLAGVCDVSVLVRRPEHARALNENGLTITGKSRLHARVRARADAAELPEFDLGIVAVKATELEPAARSLSGLSPGAAMMTIQNGLGAEEVVTRHGDWPVISAVTFMSGNRRSDDEVEYELDTPTWLGPWAGTGTEQATVEQAAELISSSGLEAVAMDDLLPAQWSKLIFNSAVNGVAALTGLPHVAAFAELDGPAALGAVVKQLVDEGEQVAAAEGVALYEDPWEMNCRAVAQGETRASDYAHVPSMLEDVRARRPTEADFIQGAIAERARRHGLHTPLTDAAYRMIKALESSW